jgi:hypothetical protein
MTDETLTAELARQVMGWRVCPDRFIKSGRNWIPKWRFSPLTDLDDAFQLLDGAHADYQLTATQNGQFTAGVRIGCSTGQASGVEKARVITLAVARTLGIDVEGVEANAV